MTIFQPGDVVVANFPGAAIAYAARLTDHEVLRSA